jgi:hypothetical protein
VLKKYAVHTLSPVAPQMRHNLIQYRTTLKRSALKMSRVITGMLFPILGLSVAGCATSHEEVSRSAMPGFAQSYLDDLQYPRTPEISTRSETNVLYGLGPI